ncbi:sensor histidine kinase [Caldimonas sp. KR1-144]|uniref:sensor histidine kinase n=1 Tax=Caldimonas sp. KR1-144 TaxID=3400911 RepID=UPI003C0DF76D
MRGWIRGGAIASVLVLACAWAHAAPWPGERTLKQFHHTRWDSKSGAPLDTRRMAQTADGWLWLGGPQGLYRFDGLRFERFADPEGQTDGSEGVSNLLALPSGELWIGYYHGGMAVLGKDGRLQRFGVQDGFDANAISTIEYDFDGNIWAASAARLLRYDGQRWQAIGEDWGLKLGSFGGMAVDANGALCVSDHSEWLMLPRGERRFRRTGLPTAGARSLQLIDGTLWMVTAESLQRIADANGAQDRPAPRPNSRRSSSVVIDGERQLWTVFCPEGLCRTRLPRDLAGSRVALAVPDEHFTHRDGLSSDVGMTILEDRGGNFWVATKSGLDRFRPVPLRRVDLPSAYTHFALADSPEEGLLIAGASATKRSLWRAGREGMAFEAPDTIFTATHVDRAGQVWFAGRGGVWRRHARGFERVPAPAEAPRAAVRALASDRLGLLVKFAGRPLYRLAGSRWETVLAPELTTPATALAAGPDGRLWLGFAQQRVAVVDAEGRLREYGEADGLSTGTVTHLHAGRRVAAAGENGVSMLRDGRFWPLHVKEPQNLRGVSGIVETPNGDLWLNGARGAVRIAAAELERWQAQPQHVLAEQLFDALDGYPSSASPVTPQPSAVMGHDGRLWFAGIDGVAWLDPASIDRPAAPAPVRILDLVADGRRFDAHRSALLPPGTSNVTIRYTALALGEPERVRFRVRLDGVDANWRSAGNNREVVYSNLGPGHHRFVVDASNPDDIWGGSQASVSFEIPPTLLQSSGFHVAVAVVGAVLLALAYQLRVGVLSRRARQRMQAVLDERERIARELHDTLLQGVQGLVLQFQAAADSIGQDPSAQKSLESVLARADRVMAEGRDRIASLRSMSEPGDDLALSLRHFGEQLAAEQRAEFVAKVQGEPTSFDPALLCEVYRIGCEALLNAFQHAQAKRIELWLQCDGRSLTLRIRDDGVGIAPELLARGRPGHWGLAGMRERAQRIGARLAIAPAIGGGTEIELVLPASGSRRLPRMRWPWQRRRATQASSAP